jgi:hypothetical protein
VKFGDVTSERQQADLRSELKRLFDAQRSGEITQEQYNVQLNEVMNATFDTAARAAENAS